jgi:hypothetical protein
VSTPNKFAALDCNVLLALEAGDDECLSTVDGLGKLGFFCIVTETTLQELADMTTDSDPEVVSHAKNTLLQITNWGSGTSLAVNSMSCSCNASISSMSVFMGDISDSSPSGNFPMRSLSRSAHS